MKKNMRKYMAMTAALVLSAATLAGCGGNKPAETAAATEAATEAATADAAEATEAATEGATEAAQAEGKVYNVGICQLVQHAALDRATQGFQDALTEKLGDQVVFDLQNAQGDSQVCSTIANQFVSNGVDLIMANATPALQACANATSEIPVLATSITSFASALDIELDENQCSGINVSGTNDLAPLDEQAYMLNELFPDVQKVGILYCSAEVNSVYQAEHISDYFDELGIAYEHYSFSDSNDLAAVVNKVVSECDVMYIPTDNTAAANTSVIDGIARPAGVPIIAGEEGICQGCGLATLSIDFYDIGYRCGEQAYDILVNGANPATMTIEDPSSVTRMYNPEIAADLGFEFGDDYQVME